MDAFGATMVANILLFQRQRTDWWLNKINGNIANDVKAINALQKEGWKIITLWECELKKNKVDKTLAKLPGKIVT